MPTVRDYEEVTRILEPYARGERLQGGCGPLTKSSVGECDLSARLAAATNEGVICWHMYSDARRAGNLSAIMSW